MSSTRIACRSCGATRAQFVAHSCGCPLDVCDDCVRTSVPPPCEGCGEARIAAWSIIGNGRAVARHTRRYVRRLERAVRRGRDMPLGSCIECERSVSAFMRHARAECRSITAVCSECATATVCPACNKGIIAQTCVPYRAAAVAHKLAGKRKRQATERFTSDDAPASRVASPTVSATVADLCSSDDDDVPVGELFESAVRKTDRHILWGPRSVQLQRLQVLRAAHAKTRD